MPAAIASTPHSSARMRGSPNGPTDIGSPTNGSPSMAVDRPCRRPSCAEIGQPGWI
ncbi:hypothetical protein AvCA_24800 [Azotobacter vinelandii CA]|uniref:Uncharacterized protein n=2 Tax=Azotobacter vinelandii TaxID=354 RepID=C1DII3_AZOVD|nr:hypothetical protein Avin_24800 [Azotobacter vinelandii DJ]AGK16671.1 hypothetical protein AvCA_24800 [Azotobacter vinelandii CA]AGK20642.1 hypothetical protein AvCA6_24800 [Azotobacter vinelandii CA6]